MKVPSVLFLSLFFEKTFAFVTSNQYRKSLIKNNAPIVTADEIVGLNRDLKEVRNNKKALLLFDYEMKDVNIENIKCIYSHLQEKKEQHSFMKEMEIVSILSFNYGRNASPMTLKYNSDVQNINLLRAFDNGNYVSKKRKVSTKDDVSFAKLNRIIDNKYNRNKSVLEKQRLYYFSPTILYKKILKRKDSLTSQYFDCSRHLYVIEDYLLPKEITYMNSINNPLGIRITGKVFYKRVLKNISKIKQEKEIIMIFGFKKMISLRRSLPLLLQNLEDKEKSRMNFVFELNAYDKKNVTQSDIDNDIRFIYMMKTKFNIENINFYVRYNIKQNHQIEIL